MTQTVDPALDEGDKGEIWGVLGGMGPLASAEFMNTIYEQNAKGPEQQSPIVFLFSDPTIPDRTDSFANGEEQILLKRLLSSMELLASVGATRIIICCMTIHMLLPKLPNVLQEKIVSLVDVIFARILQSGARHLLICTDGSRKMRLFENHPLWPGVEDRIILPDEDDQASIHRLIYEIKGNKFCTSHWHLVEALMKKYGVTSYIAGCTELHVLAKKQSRLGGQGWSDCTDPLTLIASTMSRSSIGVSGRDPQHALAK